jgi:hypothetical protein
VASTAVNGSMIMYSAWSPDEQMSLASSRRGPPLGPPPRPNPPLATDVTGRDSNGLGEQGKTPKTENAPRDHGSLRSAVDQRVFPSFLGSSGHSL